MSVLSAMLVLILVMDPVGNTAMFLCILKDIDPKRYTRIIIRELFIALAVLTFFLFLGRHILTLLDISQASLGISGGIILFLIAIKMIFHGTSEVFTSDSSEEPFMVPLAVPLVAGPSAMATVMLLMAREPERWAAWMSALLGAWLFSCVVLLSAKPLRRLLGRRGMSAMERLMGMILITVAVEMILKGVKVAGIFPLVAAG